MTALIRIIKKIKHLIELSEFFVIIQTNYFTTMNICRQKLITSANSSIRSNIKLVRIFQYFFQVLFDMKHKFDKNNVISDVLSKLNSTNIILSRTKNYSKLNALYIYNITLVKLNKKFSQKII